MKSDRIVGNERITIDNARFEIDREYIFLRQLIHNSDLVLLEINRRIKLAWRAFRRNLIIE